MMDSCHAESVYWTTLRDMNYCAYHIDVETGFRQLESDKRECDQRLWNYMEREVEIKMQRWTKIYFLEGLIVQPYLKSFNSYFVYYENMNIDTLFLCQEWTRPFQN